jgi:hypothetical protein
MAASPKMKSDEYVEQAVVQLFALKLRAGATETNLRKFADKCLRQATLSTERGTRTRGLDIHRLGSVLRAWHKETKYLTYDGLPRPLRTAGKAGLKSLICRFYPSEKFLEVFESLREYGLIRQGIENTWVPSGKTARIPKIARETLEHVAEGVARYVETVTKNVTAKDESNVLFERSCKVTRLPASEFGSFREYVAQQALAFLSTVDDWLETRNSPKASSSRICTAGVHTFAYVAGKGDPRRTFRR